MPDLNASALLALLGQVPGLSAAEITALAARWNRGLHLRRGEFLVSPGQVELRLCLVRQGLLRISTPYWGSCCKSADLHAKPSGSTLSKG